MIGWAAYAEIEYEQYEKQKEQAQRNSAIKGRKREDRVNVLNFY